MGRVRERRGKTREVKRRKWTEQWTRKCYSQLSQKAIVAYRQYSHQVARPKLIINETSRVGVLVCERFSSRFRFSYPLTPTVVVWVQL